MEERPIVIAGKSYISSRRAAILFGYTNDYIGQLSRSKKIQSIMVGRDRFIDYSSLVGYVNNINHNIDKSSNFTNRVLQVPADISGNSILTKNYIGETNKYDISRLPGSSNPAAFWTTVATGIIGLALFFSVTRIGANAILNMGNILPAGLYFASSEQYISQKTFYKVGTFLSEIDRVYLTYLDKVELSLMKLWRDSSKRLLAFMGPIFGLDESSEVVIEKNISTTTTLVNSSVTSSNDYFQSSGSSVEEIRMIVREIVDEQLSKNIDYTSRAKGPNLGLIVRPGSADTVSDETIINGIKESFSDEVRVSLDSSRSAGIIRPVFRAPTDDFYRFILVPINQGD